MRDDDDGVEVEAPDLPHTIELRYPIETRSKDGEVLETVGELTFRRLPNAGDIMAADGLGDVGRGLKILSRLTGQPMRIVERLDVRGGEGSDLQRALAVVNAFFA